MSYVAKLSAALAAASVLVLSASAAHASVNIPKPVINVAVAKPVLSTPISSSVRQGSFAGKPATLQTTTSNWQGPAGSGTQSTTLIYQNGKVVGAISAAAVNSPKTGSGPTTSTPVANHPAPSTPAPAASHPAPAKPAAASAPAPKKVTFTPVEYPAFTDQYGTVKGYYVNGKLVMGLTGPSGTACSTGLAYQIPGSSAVSNNYSSGAITVHVVNCTIKS